MFRDLLASPCIKGASIDHYVARSYADGRSREPSETDDSSAAPESAGLKKADPQSLEWRLSPQK